jgi:tetratricopeptide (TPR) repeat protein
VGIDSVTWTKMVRQLPLSRAEAEILRRFEEDPTGRQFLPLSEILRNHQLIDESVELLHQGVQDHPGFAVARVVLARELFQRGMVIDSWDALARAPTPLTDNVLAQKLQFKLAVLLGDEYTARSALQQLRVQQGVDPEIKRLAERLDMDGIALTRESYKTDLLGRGIELRMPNPGDLDAPVERSIPKNLKLPDETKGRGKKFILEYELDAATRKNIEKFHVVPLAEVFAPGVLAEKSASSTKGHVELDSTTLADIYAKQGFYAKALAIYRRLLRMAPHNDLIRMKVSELARLDKEQRHEDLESDPIIYERMEVVEIIDRQTRFLNGLLDSLTQKRS